jgi:hypothetical protein
VVIYLLGFGKISYLVPISVSLKNTRPHSSQVVQNILNLNTSSSKTKHLGFPFLFHKSKKNLFDDLLTFFQNRILCRKTNVLSQAGCTTFIKSVDAALLLPKTICSSLEKMFKDFWWGFKKEKEKEKEKEKNKKTVSPSNLGILYGNPPLL